MARFFLLLLVSAAAMLSSGCASIVTGQNQALSVETRAKGEMISGANCELANDKGKWFVTTPGSVTVTRAYGDLAVRCKHDKHPPGSMVVKSSTKAMAFGNVIFGGVIGAAVDAGTGAAYDYPTLITLELGLDKPAEPPPEEPKKN